MSKKHGYKYKRGDLVGFICPEYCICMIVEEFNLVTLQPTVITSECVEAGIDGKTRVRLPYSYIAGEYSTHNHWDTVTIANSAFLVEHVIDDTEVLVVDPGSDTYLKIKTFLLKKLH
jgi:hypothetical protein